VKLNVRVNRKKEESLTRQITDQLDGLIATGALESGSQLPSERELAGQLKVARNVVRGAYENLESAGKIQSDGRKGRRVRAAAKKKAAGKKK
jgi:DNA-binding transcriptional regulator YhcF (GntR family)